MRRCLRLAVLAGAMSLVPVFRSPALAQQTASCPLTANQEVAAVKAFKRLAPVFREPRCLNCHGGVDPYIEDGGHEGGLIDVLGMTDNDKIRQSDKAMEAMHLRCDNCHIQGWTMPMKANHFVNKSDQALCMQMKRRLESASIFKFHMERDSDIGLGFAGTRGLTDPDPPTKKPRMTHPQMLNAARAWTRAMGEKWQKPEDCGCVIHGFVLQLQHKVDTDPTDIGFKIGDVKFSGAVDFAVRLQPVPNMPEGWFTGQVSVVRPISVHHVRPDCSGKSAPRPENWDVRAIADEEGKSMRFLFTLDYEHPLGTLTCTRAPTMEVTGWMFSELTHREDMRIPTTAGAMTKFEAAEIGTREWLTVTVLQGPEPAE